LPERLDLTEAVFAAEVLTEIERHAQC